MPSLPEQLNLATLRGHDDTAKWSRNLVNALVAVWSNVVYTVNALCHVDTLANRTSTPSLDETLFVSSDTQQLWVGVSGAWKNSGPRRGTATVSGGTTTKSVSLSPAEPDASYTVVATAAGNMGAIWITTKAAGSFVINVATAPGGDTAVDWTLWRT